MSAPAPLKTTVTATVADGYARLVFTAKEYIDGSARLAGNVLIVSFKQPLDITVERMAEQASDYIGAARRDPDGTAVRIGLAQTVTVHTMSAGEKFFVDLLPTSWTGLPPGLPQDVVDELARRARQADLLMKRERERNEQQKLAPIRVHVATEPTFTRYVFDVSDHIGVSADRDKNRLILNFDTPLTFDLGDADAALPNGVQEITSELDDDTSLVRFILASNIDVRTFRDEQGYVVDVVNPDAGSSAPQPTGAQQGAAAPATKPAAGTEAGQGDDAAAKFAAAAAKLAKAVEAPATPAPQPPPLAPAPPPAAPAAAPAAPAATPPAPQAAAAPRAAAPPAAVAAATPPPAPTPAPAATPPAPPPQVAAAAAAPSVSAPAPAPMPAPAPTPSPAAATTPAPASAAAAMPSPPPPAAPAATPAASSSPAPPAAPTTAPTAAAAPNPPAPAPALAPAAVASQPSDNVPAHPAAHPHDPNAIAVDLTQQGGDAEIVVSVSGSGRGGGLPPRRHAVDRVRFQSRHRSRRP